MVKRRKKRAVKRANPAKKRRSVRRRRNPGWPVLAVNPARHRRVKRRSHPRKVHHHRVHHRRNPGGVVGMVTSKSFLTHGALLLLGGAVAVGVSRMVEKHVTQPPKVLAAIEAGAGLALLAAAGYLKLGGEAATVAAGAAAGMGFSAGGKAWDAFMLPPPAPTPAPPSPSPDTQGVFGLIGEDGDDLDGLEGTFGAVDYSDSEDEDGDPLFDDELDPFGGADEYS